MFQEIRLNYFKVPSLPKQTETKLIAVLDASGSMSLVWKYVAKYYNEIKRKIKMNCAITFDTRARSFPNGELTPNINTYGGGETNITNACLELNKMLSLLKEKKNVTILFVSDGEGDFNEEAIRKSKPKIENLNFICIGIGKKFPTFISMSLRQMYHNGDETIPPLFLIETDDLQDNQIESAIKEEFISASKYFCHQTKIKISPCYQYPWEGLTELAWAGSWVASYDEVLECDKQILQKVQVKGEEISQIATFWLSKLQLLSLTQKVPDQAKTALQEILKMNQKRKLTFLERVQERKLGLEQIQKELRFLAASRTLSQLDEATAAQRLKIGTQIGKFHNRALKMCGISIEGFKVQKEEFMKMMNQNQFVDHDFPTSIITLQNQVDVLTDPQLIEGLNNCDTQYHLVSSLPIIGYGIQVIRTDDSRIQPYKIQVIGMAKINQFIDSITLIESPNHTLEFSIGQDEKETFNCLIPLYKDEIMKPFLRSNIFHIQMTFVVTQNSDTCFEFAYAGLLGNLLLFMISQQESQWKNEMIDLINSSFLLAYSDHQSILYHSEQLIKDPIGTLADDNLDTKSQCEDISKTILILNQIKDKFTNEQLTILVKRLIIEAICREIRYENFFKQQIEIDNQIEQTVINDLVASFTELDLSNIGSFDQLRTQVREKLKQVDQMKFTTSYILDQEKFENFMNATKFTIKTLEALYRHFLNEEMDPNLFIVAAYHSRIEKSFERSKQEIEWDTGKILNTLVNEMILQKKFPNIEKKIVTLIQQKCKELEKYKAKKSNDQRMPRVERRRLRKEKLRQQKQNQNMMLQQNI